MKYLRTYEIQIFTPQGESITIQPPFSISCQIDRHIMASTNKCSLSITNLGITNRNKIFKDRYNTTKYFPIIIRAGYNSEAKPLFQFNALNALSTNLFMLPTIFKGNILEAYSYKQGTEWITQIEAQDGLYGVQNGFVSQTYASGTNQQNIFKDLITSMPNMLIGALGSLTEGTNDRGKVMFGQSADLIYEESQGNYFIDNEKLNILNNDESLSGSVILLDSEQLKTTPRRRDAFLDCELLFSPELEVGRICELQSSYPVYNGQYRIEGFSHNVIISEAECGEATTTVNLNAGARQFLQVGS
jgi:hypothetical protein